MKLTKKHNEQIQRYVKRFCEKNSDPFHHFDHALAVSKMAAYIAKKEKAEVEVCRIAGLFHDIAPKTRKKAHGPQSAALAKKLLTKIGIGKEFIDKVYLAISYHDSSRQHLARTTEEKIVFEADKLMSIGPVGLIREYGDLLIKGYEPMKSVSMTIKYLSETNPSFTTKTAKEFKRELRNFNRYFIKLYNKYY